MRGGGEAGDPRENPPTEGIVRSNSHLRKSGDPAGDCTRFAFVRGERANRSATAVPNFAEFRSGSKYSYNLEHARVGKLSYIVRIRQQQHVYTPFANQQRLFGSPLVDDQPIMNAVKYRVGFDAVCTNRTMHIPRCDPKNEPASLFRRQELHREYEGFFLKRAISNLAQPPATIQALKTAAIEEWDNLPHEILNDLAPVSSTCRWRRRALQGRRLMMAPGRGHRPRARIDADPGRRHTAPAEVRHLDLLCHLPPGAYRNAALVNTETYRKADNGLEWWGKQEYSEKPIDLWQRPSRLQCAEIRVCPHRESTPAHKGGGNTKSLWLTSRTFGWGEGGQRLLEGWGLSPSVKKPLDDELGRQRRGIKSPTKANWIRFAAGSPDFRIWESGGRRVFSGIPPFTTPLQSGATPISPRFTLIGSQAPDVKAAPRTLHLLDPVPNLRRTSLKCTHLCMLVAVYTSLVVEAHRSSVLVVHEREVSRQRCEFSCGHEEK
ncbi:hypothetical protein PR048_026129 [Dryococelus australis]|uniref:Uncharacterized protein n=1 Tax=Dryococelus australis TaxID=614101 RepID=A0ABQ9GKG1_9NEOP|nr:hypothetical protein PR048_026129 [Dryococelus australis]